MRLFQSWHILFCFVNLLFDRVLKSCHWSENCYSHYSHWKCRMLLFDPIGLCIFVNIQIKYLLYRINRDLQGRYCQINHWLYFPTAVKSQCRSSNDTLYKIQNIILFSVNLGWNRSLVHRPRSSAVQLHPQLFEEQKCQLTPQCLILEEIRFKVVLGTYR